MLHHFFLLPPHLLPGPTISSPFYLFPASPSVSISLFSCSSSSPCSFSPSSLHLSSIFILPLPHLCFYKVNPLVEPKAESDPDTLDLCRLRIQKIVTAGGIPLLNKWGQDPDPLTSLPSNICNPSYRYHLQDECQSHPIPSYSITYYTVRLLSEDIIDSFPWHFFSPD